jgi:hypothetical protein
MGVCCVSRLVLVDYEMDRLPTVEDRRLEFVHFGEGASIQDLADLRVFG